MSSDAFTSLAFIADPSENFTPSFSVNVHVSPSADDSHFVARPASTLVPSLVVRSSVSYTLTEMNSAGLSSICQGTNGLNGSALRAIFSTFGPLLALGCVVADCVPLGAHAPTSSTAIATPMTGHREFSANI